MFINMKTVIIAMFGNMEIVLILAVVLIMFGAKKLPELAKGLGQGIREFRKATSGVEEEVRSVFTDTPSPPPQVQQPPSDSSTQQDE